MAAGCDIFLIDFLLRPFAKIYQKMPFLMMVILLLVYGIIGYVVFRSAYMNGEQH
ncbi:MAG: hypothetical protein JSS86_24775 [Cyanobacteria bacterium SZAS LIN-2]|nr:hypothetical protein [Cyanobacteria bacterium SZAS LIN-3]MBS1999572.1 hypothetical protein [Cyanobacteria bacterium SZAS LIN-2]MBS2008444.1 hypothetical protein [Cyanobacteria bacterium SZAS TMP-1]